MICTICGDEFVQRGRVSAHPKCKTCRSRCVVCGEPKRTRNSARCVACAGPRVEADPLVDSTTRYADDPAAQMFVSHFEAGAPARVVADAMGISRQLVEFIERQAIKHLRARLRLVGIEEASFGRRQEHALAGTWSDEGTDADVRREQSRSRRRRARAADPGFRERAAQHSHAYRRHVGLVGPVRVCVVCQRPYEGHGPFPRVPVCNACRGEREQQKVRESKSAATYREVSS